MRLNTKEREPQTLRRAMKQWRAGLSALPRTYIAYHEAIAREELFGLREKFGFEIVNIKMISDGWMDGMRVLTAVIETRSNQLISLKYNDGNVGFMRRSPSGYGHSATYEKDFE